MARTKWARRVVWPSSHVDKPDALVLDYATGLQAA